MSDYKQMYYRLSGMIADAIEKLQEIQRESEEIYLSGGNADACPKKRLRNDFKNKH